MLTESMRVGYVVRRYPRYSETFVVHEILAHEKAGLEIEIFALEPPSDTHFQDIIAQVKAPVNYMPSKGLKTMDFWLAIEEASEVLPGLWSALEVARGEEARNIYNAVLLARAVRLKGILHLHAHFATAATTVARLAARFAEVPYTFTAHAYDIYSEKVQTNDFRRKLLDAAAVITVSEYNLEYLRQTYGAAASRVYRIYNGLDLKRFSYTPPQNRPPWIVSVGRLIEKKGFADLIEACAILASRGRHFSCRIIGTGPHEADMRTQIERLGLKTRVELIGPRPQSEVIKYVQSAAVFTIPCIVGKDGNRDGLPTTLLEAAALGTPCISTDVTGIPELLRDGETGLIVPQHDPASLATAIERLLVDPDLRIRLSTQARHLIEKEFDIHRNSAQIRVIFQEASRTGIKVAQEVF